MLYHSTHITYEHLGTSISEYKYSWKIIVTSKIQKPLREVVRFSLGAVLLQPHKKAARTPSLSPVHSRKPDLKIVG